MVCASYTAESSEPESSEPDGGTSIDGGTKMKYTINTIKNLKGTVEARDTPHNDLLWHIDGDDFSYGSNTAYPCTYLDAEGNEQAAVFQKGAWDSGKKDYALDTGRSFGLAEKYASKSEVRVLSKVAGKTMQLQYPASNTLLYALVAVVLIMLYFALKR